MKKPQLLWDEVSDLIGRLGREDFLAARLKAWRLERGWSLTRLSKELGKAGHPLTRSSIERMEKLGRAISIGDALAISRVFNKSMVAMLLPDEALHEHDGWVAVLNAIEALGNVQAAWNEYRAEIDRAQSAMWRYPELRDRVGQELNRAGSQFEEAHRSDWANNRQRRIELGDPVPNGKSADAWVAKQPPTPELMALQDSLAEEAVAAAGWIKEQRLRQRDQ